MEDKFAQELELNRLVGAFYENKNSADYYKRKSDEQNKRIKELMAELGIDEFENDFGEVAKITVQNRESFQEDKLIAKLKQLGIVSPIKTVEVIDYDDLEDVIYNGMLDASILAEFRDTKQVTTLKVSKKKGE